MKSMDKNSGQKGRVNLYSILLGILLVIAVFAAIKYFHDRNNDITIHLPKVEVH